MQPPEWPHLRRPSSHEGPRSIFPGNLIMKFQRLMGIVWPAFLVACVLEALGIRHG